MHSGYDIIYFGLFRWNGPYSSISIAMAKEFSKHSRIFYVNHPYTIRDYFSKELSGIPQMPKFFEHKAAFEKDERLSNNFTSVTPPLTYPINFLPKGPLYHQLWKQNNKKIYSTIQQIIKKYQVKQYIYINCFDPFYAPTLPDFLQPALNIYQCVDDITQNDYTVKHGPDLEEQAVRTSDITLVTSQELFRLKSPYSKNIHILNNAADLDNFKKAIEIDYPRPSEIKDVKGKIIGYIGNLDAIRVDYELLKSTALAHPDKTLLLIGPLNNTIYKEIGLDKLPNVIFTGGKAIEDLPQYVKYFDCGIIPFKYNKLTKSIYPLKINEYLSAGKSIISTNFSEDIADFKSNIYLADTHDQFISLIDDAVKTHPQEVIDQRLSVAKENTWSARINQFWEIVDLYL